MEFFNKKEEVIDLQLTQYGRHLMSKGKFKPVYYSFYDDNILYNVAKTGRTEVQNEAEKRIKENPTLHPQVGFSSLEREFQNNYDLVLMGKSAGDASIQRTPEKHYLLSHPIGTSDINSEYAPSWSVLFLNGSISGSASSTLELKEKSGDKNILNIPQINSHMKIEVTDVSGGAFEYDEAIDGPLRSNFGVLTDEENTYIVLKVIESNGLYQKKNFDIELYEVYEEETDSGNIIETLRPLKFSKSYVAEDELTFMGSSTPKEDQEHVEYYFDFRVDDEINTQALCRLDPVNEKLGVFADERTVLCQDLLNQKKKAIGNIYVKEGAPPGDPGAGAPGTPGDSSTPGEDC